MPAKEGENQQGEKEKSEGAQVEMVKLKLDGKDLDNVSIEDRQAQGDLNVFDTLVVALKEACENAGTDIELNKTESEATASARELARKIDKLYYDFYAKLVRMVPEEGIPKEKMQKEVQKYIRECKSLVNDHRRTLMIAPSVWNKLKDIINQFLDKCTSFEKRYAVKETELSKKISPFFDKTAKYGEPIKQKAKKEHGEDVSAENKPGKN